ADDYAALPGATIVRGFVRNYARLLKLDAAPLLQQLDAVLPWGPAEVRPPDKIGVASESRVPREFSALMSIALVLLLAASLLVLWHFFAPKPQPAVTATSASAETGSGQTPAAASLAPSPPSPVSAAVPAPAENPVSSQTDAEAGKVGDPAEKAAPTLHFSFADRSWVEVIDANRHVLHSGENPPGSQLNLTGQPPFDIVIGNAGKVFLSYDGKPIDLAPHTRAEVARLRLE
ncbi:MAG: RodZ domain-containing protein, partial [Rhodocyclaceae bacterium]